ncbi:hypothetical protein, partial [Vibrio aestuarianus]|uniref:hypothetical protein n=2 Tax=Vibrio TaxID=662 RepID=UPI0021C42F75
QIRRSFKAFVTETTWNTQRRRKRTDNTKKTFWRNNATKLTSTSKSASETANQTRKRSKLNSASQDPEVRSAESSKAHERLDLNTLF